MKKLIVLPIVGLALLILSFSGCEVVDEGTRGIKTTWGKVSGEPLTPGIYFYNPISSSIFEMEVLEKKLEHETDCFTKDTQTVKVGYTVTYYPDPTKIASIYSQFGRDWDNKLVGPAVLGSLKDAIGQYIADDLVSKREAVKQAAQKEIVDALAQRNITVTRLDLTNLDFDDAYEKAVEEKVVAIQRAAEAKNKTVQVEEESRQMVLNAQAEAEAMKIKTQALSQNKSLIGYEAIRKWDGKLPKIMMGDKSLPIIDLSKIKDSE